MFKRFLKVHRFSSPALREHPKPPRPLTIEPLEDESSVLKIVHPGGKIERYYMAIPAAKILEKYPTCELAKPELFVRPWSSVVRSEKILTPGQKFLLVPRRSVKKLRKRIKKPTRDAVESSSFISQASNFSFSGQSGVSSSSFVPQSDTSVVSSSFSKSALKKQSGALKKHVRFAGIDDVEEKAGSGSGFGFGFGSGSSTLEKKSEGQGKKRNKYFMGWQPKLAMINESERQGMA